MVRASEASPDGYLRGDSSSAASQFDLEDFDLGPHGGLGCVVFDGKVAVAYMLHECVFLLGDGAVSATG